MTGAPMPPGADSILPIERCDVVDDTQVRLLEPPKPHFVRRQGENLRSGTVALSKGAVLTPARLGLCATMGYPEVNVVRRLKIAIVSTGDELKSPGEPLRHGEIYESNSYGLAGLVEWAGHEPVRFASVSDSLNSLRIALNEAASTCDVVRSLEHDPAVWPSGQPSLESRGVPNARCTVPSFGTGGGWTTRMDGSRPPMRPGQIHKGLLNAAQGHVDLYG